MRPRSLERRLFTWLFALAVVPALLVLVGGVWLADRTLDLAGSLGPWEQVAESGRALLDALPPPDVRTGAGEPGESAEAEAPALAEAAERHRTELSESLLLARRWAYVGERLASFMPAAALVLALVLAGVALLASRALARGLAAPIRELVGWAELLGREQDLPAAGAGEDRDFAEIRVLRQALRRAATEHAAAREKALQSERLRAWGEMARRVAHEMKNPLTPIRLAAHRLRATDAAAAGDELVVIEEETERLEELAARFSELGRPPDGPASPLDLHELLTGLVATDVPAGVDVSLPRGGAPVVEAHYDSMLRAFRNLIRNAVEAAGPGGALRIDIARDPGDPPAWVEVVVADSGPGLPAGAGERIFEPDFTTKSRGTGLGLALVRQAVEREGGTVRARPGVDGGAELVVRLPVAAGRG